MRMEGSNHHSSGSVSRPYTPIRRNSSKISVSGFMGYLKGKSAAMMYEQFGDLKYKYQNKEFWCRGYYVDTVGKNESRIAEYIENQLKEDEMGEQLVIPSVSPFTGRK